MRRFFFLLLGFCFFNQLSNAQCVTAFDTINVGCADTGDATLCLPFTPTDYFVSTIVVGSDTLGGFPSVCDPDTIRAYDMSISRGIFGCDSIQLSGPWVKNGDTLLAAGTYFDSLEHLVDSMAGVDPTGSWTWDGVSFITTSNNEDTFSNLDIFSWCTFEGNSIALNTVIFYGGIEITVPRDACIWVTITLDSTGCTTDSIYVCSDCVSPDTIWVTLSGGDTDTTCVSLDELSADSGFMMYTCDSMAMSYGGDTIMFLDDSCVVYTAAMGYMGDTACVVICDSTICDTTYIIYMPGPPPPVDTCDTLIMEDLILVEHCDTTDALACLMIEPTTAVTWTISVNGDTLSPFDIRGCLPDTMRAYDLTITDSVLTCDSLQLIRPWTKNGDTLLSAPMNYSSWADIVAAVMAADPSGGWMWDGSQFLSTTNFADSFGNLEIFSFCKGTWNIVALNRVITFRGTGIEVPAGMCSEIIVDNNMGCVDTVEVCVVCPLKDTTPYETPIKHCFDDSLMLDSIAACNTPANGMVTILGDSCIVYSPNNGWYGWDTACIVVCDSSGCDTLSWIILTLEPDTIIAMEDWDTTRINTPVTVNVLANDTYLGRPCPDSMGIHDSTSHGSIAFNFLNCTYSYTPDSNWCGTDSFHYWICDPNGCDSAWAFIVVNCVGAVEDWDTTESGDPVIIDVLANDNIPCDTPSMLSILAGPSNGAAIVNADMTVTYTSTDGWCGTDSFQYVVCCDSVIDCDSAWAYVVVNCPPDDLIIYNGFSPNGDSINDVFVISGADGCDITLQVYNRWGNIVYKSDDYQNDWNGTWQKTGESLPDGTYYYVVRVQNCDSERNIIQNSDMDPSMMEVTNANVAGYVTIHRGSKN